VGPIWIPLNEIKSLFIRAHTCCNVNRNEILEEVENAIRNLPGFVDMIYLDRERKERITQLEKQAEENGAAGGLLPFRNTGVWEALGREVSLVIVFEAQVKMLGVDSSPVIMVDGQGNVLGEFVGPEKQKELRGREGVHFLSDDFVIYSNVTPRGEPHFVLPSLEFRALDHIKGISNITAGSISPLSDYYIRELLGYIHTDYWTHLVGFDLDPD